jgi:hypothetical protein
MRECEARYVLDMESQASRDKYLASTLRRRGEEGQKDLKQRILLVEAYRVVSMPSLDERRSYLQWVQRVRGDLAHTELKLMIVRLWESRR